MHLLNKFMNNKKKCYYLENKGRIITRNAGPHYQTVWCHTQYEMSPQ
jgi:hypothetical protein